MISDFKYCVCSTRLGELFVMTSTERETMLSVLIEIEGGVPSFVVKRFYTLEEAKKFIADQNAIDLILEKIF